MANTNCKNTDLMILACATSLLLAGCFGSRPSKGGEALTDAETAVTRAEQARVGDYDAVDLRLSRENLSAARAASLANENVKNKKDEEQARWFAARAKVHADLGLARAEVSRLQALTRALQREIDQRTAPAIPAPAASQEGS